MSMFEDERSSESRSREIDDLRRFDESKFEMRFIGGENIYYTPIVDGRRLIYRAKAGMTAEEIEAGLRKTWENWLDKIIKNDNSKLLKIEVKNHNINEGAKVDGRDRLIPLTMNEFFWEQNTSIRLQFEFNGMISLFSNDTVGIQNAIRKKGYYSGEEFDRLIDEEKDLSKIEGINVFKDIKEGLLPEKILKKVKIEKFGDIYLYSDLLDKMEMAAEQIWGYDVFERKLDENERHIAIFLDELERMVGKIQIFSVLRQELISIPAKTGAVRKDYLGKYKNNDSL